MNIKHKQSGQVFEIGAYYPKRPGSSLHRFFKIEDGRILEKSEGYLGFGGTGHTWFSDDVTEDYEIIEG